MFCCLSLFLVTFVPLFVDLFLANNGSVIYRILFILQRSIEYENILNGFFAFLCR